MREILFRGRYEVIDYKTRTVSFNWAEGCLDTTHCGDVIFSNSTARFAVDHETVGEYTGLKDRNGKRVFEGDVVLRCYTGSTGKENRVKQLIVFEKGCFLTKRIDDDYFHGVDPNGYNFYEDYQELETFTKECSSVNGSFEVIGNIHDNPELVKRRKA